jgi:hypothetical protein
MYVSDFNSPALLLGFHFDRQARRGEEEIVPGTPLFISGTTQVNRTLSWQWRIIAMLVFYLPIIILEAMLQPWPNKREAARAEDDEICEL